jgi:tRNA(Ile)-lysidine synthase
VKRDLAAQVRACVLTHVPPDSPLVLGLSGGIDSMVLLHVLVRGLRMPPGRISAIHINHQLSPRAAEWAAFCRRRCRDFGVKLKVVKVAVKRGNSTEAAARTARYRVFAESGSGIIVLAHNRDDQAETVLLQLLRGTGPRGLAAMPAFRAAVQDSPAVLRPLLDVPRHLIAAHARQHRLQWIEDDSNDDRAYLRNFLRHEVLPLLETRLPGTGATLARAARLQAETSELLDALAVADLGGTVPPHSLPLEPLKSLPPHRGRNVLRYFLRNHGLLMPDADHLQELLRQVLAARDDARVCIRTGDAELRRFRGTLYVIRRLPAPGPDFAVTWNGRGALRLGALGGVLRLERRSGAGVAADLLRGARIELRVRRGGETLRLAAGGRSRTVRNLLQEAALPPWMRDRLPFLYVGGELAAVAGIGVDVRFQAPAGHAGYWPLWLPD